MGKLKAGEKASTGAELTVIKKKVGAPAKYDRAACVAVICAELEKGVSLNQAVRVSDGLPSIATFLTWVEEDPRGIGERYARARSIGYHLLADEIVDLSNKTHEWVMIQDLDAYGKPIYSETGEPRMKQVLMPLNSDVIAHTRLQIDTRKWMLSKMLPKIYGEKVTQEITGTDGGPITMASVDLKNLSDNELANMQTLLAKAAG
jgi:hypothetical protein